MNTLSDLRATLDAHAERVPDGEATVRAAAVRHRVSVVRRRRRAVGVSVLSLVLIVVGGATLVRRGGQDTLPAAPTVLGVQAPTVVHSLGYTYRTDGTSQTIADHGSIDVPTSSTPRLFSWTTDQPATVTLKLPDGRYWTSTKSHFRDFVVVPPGQGGELQVSTSAGRVGLASYDVTAAQPDSVSRAGITFRNEVAGVPLLTATIGAAGRGEVRAPYRSAGGQVSVSVLCIGAPASSQVHVAFAGAAFSGGCGDSTFDPGSDVIGATSAGRSGKVGVVRAWVSGADSDQPLPADELGDVRLGVGLYGPQEGVPVAGMSMARTLEYGGHTWRLSGATRSYTAPIRFRVGDRPAVLQAAMRMSPGAPTTLRVSATGVPAYRSAFSGQGSGLSGDVWAPAGATVRVTRSTPGAFGVGVYRMVPGR